MTFAEQFERSAKEGARMRADRGLAAGQAASVSEVERRLAAPETVEPGLTELAVRAQSGDSAAVAVPLGAPRDGS